MTPYGWGKIGSSYVSIFELIHKIDLHMLSYLCLIYIYYSQL